LQAAARFIFGEQALVHGFAADIVDQVCHAGKVRVKACHL
jgi:hypothetical protein